MTTAELIYRKAKGLTELEAKEVLDFVEFLKGKAKQQRIAELKIGGEQRRDKKVDMKELDQFGSVYDGDFDRDACYDRTELC
ncbi:MAG: hypothetical protein Q3M24_14185 [Candidatus Electrothrix aestuarii]|uniref:DUF2281 domain-containing protein n=1 Tax=Candidatus Electrothrix aestuarii TaxID=3062594 RepID=A0AAU8LQB1_9BACT|nr:hypothetical protein [Candidatus Electrothrix aestuarii]WPD24816.1 MAG: hypothetical protein SD837_09665 [Candidatus Electrothrix sp. GW3-3]